VVGGIITCIARKMGVGEESGINKIEGNNRLNLDTLTYMMIVKSYGPTNMYQYELRLPKSQCLNVSMSGVVENLFYVGTNPQVKDDGDDGDDEDEEGAQLHDDPVHLEHEAGGQYDNDRWTWMQN
jgi:hypothetical protein